MRRQSIPGCGGVEFDTMAKKPGRSIPHEHSKAPASEVSPQEAYKKAWFETQKKLDNQWGPRAINGDLSEEQKEEARRTRDAGESLKGLYSRLSEEDLRRIVTDVVNREVSILGDKLTPSFRQKLFFALFGFAVGVMQNATWDILKLFVPHLKNLFNAAEPTENMKKIADWEGRAKAAVPEDMRNFADQNYKALLALRAQTWSQLQVTIESTELALVLENRHIRDLMEAFENRLFAPHQG
jgi:hypothetical protein